MLAEEYHVGVVEGYVAGALDWNVVGMAELGPAQPQLVTIKLDSYC